MQTIPLFPLNTVLFPGTPLALRVFEPRYRRMMAECVEAKTPFGVVLIRRGAEAFGPPAEPHDIGCIAAIQRVEKLDGGNMNVVAKGGERFTVRGVTTERSVLIADVEPLPLPEPGPSDRLKLREESRDLSTFIRRYLEVLASAGGGRVKCMTLPEAPDELAWLGAFLLQIAPKHKQTLLACHDATSLVSAVRDLYVRELPLLRLVARESNVPVAEPFSGN